MSLRLFWNFNIFCLLYIHINNIKFTYDKLESVKFGFSIFDATHGTSGRNTFITVHFSKFAYNTMFLYQITIYSC